MKHIDELSKFVAEGDFEYTDEGLVIHSSALLKGSYITLINGKDPQESQNLLPTEGIAYILGLLGATSKVTAFYLAPYAGAVNPAANWTAANFTSNATEITSTSEGFSNATRPVWTYGAVSAGVIGNSASPAAFTVDCSTVLNISGMGLLSSDIRGGTAGVLLSATRYPAVRVVNDGDTFEVIYNISLTDS